MRRWQWGGDESNASANTVTTADLTAKLKQETLPKVETSTLTATITQSNYENIVKAANTDIYTLISTINGMPRNNFFNHGSNFRQEHKANPSLDFSKTKTDTNIFKCSTGSAQATREKYLTDGETQNGSKMAYKAEGCVTEGGNIFSGTMDFTVADSAKKITNSVYKFKNEDKGMILDLDGFDASQWQNVKQNGNDRYQQTATYHFTLKTGTAENLKVAKLDGKADFIANIYGDAIQPQYLNVHKGSVQTLADFGTVELYTEQPLIYTSNASGKVVQSGKVVIKAKNGSITINITDGKALFEVFYDHQTSTLVFPIDATAFLYSSN